MRKDYEVDSKAAESRNTALRSEIQNRLEATVQTLTSQSSTNINVAELKKQITAQVYNEQSARDRAHDEYERKAWS